MKVKEVYWNTGGSGQRAYFSNGSRRWAVKFYSSNKCTCGSCRLRWGSLKCSGCKRSGRIEWRANFDQEMAEAMADEEVMLAAKQSAAEYQDVVDRMHAKNEAYHAEVALGERSQLEIMRDHQGISYESEVGQEDDIDKVLDQPDDLESDGKSE